MNRDFNERFDGLFDDRQDSRLPRARTLLPRTPKKFKVEKAGTGVRATVTDWAPESAETVGSAAISYLVYWAETVDTTTDAGIAAGFARATLLAPPIPAPGKDDGEATGFFSDPKYLTGYFYCVGVDAKGNRSDVVAPVRISTGTGGTVPPDVEHFQATESGEQHNLTTISAVSYSFRVPVDGSTIDRVQFNYKNYPNLNQKDEGESVRITAAAGGTQIGKLQLPIGRRIGSGTISIVGTAVTGVGTNFLSLAAQAGGDYLEVFGFRALIASVASNTSMTLSGAWAAGNPAVAVVSDWQVIGSVTIYAVSIGLTGARRDDIDNAPNVTVVLDGDLSTPNAPSLTATAIGNIIRIEITPPSGTQLARLVLYRATNAGATFDKTTCAVLHAFEIDNSNSATKTYQWDDSDFTVYQREQSQVFSYFATAVNVRDMESAASTRAEGTARLDSPSDGGSSLPARFVAKNLLWDSMFSGTAGDINAAAAGTVDADMGMALPAGYYRAVGSISGSGSAPAFQNGREVLLAIAGAVGSTGQSLVTWSIDASDHATAANRRVQKGKMLSLQMQARHSAGTINGSLNALIYQTQTGASAAVTGATNATPIVITTGAAHGFSTGQKRVAIAGVTGNTAANGIWTITVTGATTFSLDGSVGNGVYGAGSGGISGLAGLKHRSASDVVDFDGYLLTITGSDITDVHSLYWGAFYIDPGFVTEQIALKIYYDTTNYSGVNLAFMEPMLAYGDGLPYWSAAIDQYTTYPPVGGGVAYPRGRFTDLDGGRREYVRLP